VYCLDDSTGELIWSYDTGGRVFSSPCVADDKVYVGSYDSKMILCLDAANGDSLWTYTVSLPIYGSPVAANGKVYFGATNRWLYCLDANTGSVNWSYYTGGAVYGAPTVADGMVYVGTYNDKIVCVNESSGSLVWSYTTGDYVDTSPAIADGRLYVGSRDNKVYAFETAPTECEVTPSSLDFGTVVLGDSADLVFTIANIYENTLTGDVTELCNHYNIVSGGGAFSLAPGESLLVTVRFEPVSVGTHNCTIETGTELCTDVACTGVAENPPICEIFPVSIDFDTVSVAHYLDEQFTIRNAGGDTLSGVVSESCDYYSVVSGGGAYSLAAGESLLVTVRFEPDSVGEHNCTIETGSVLCSDVSCTGVGEQGPGCQISPTILEFDTVMVIAGDPVDESFSITNTGRGRLNGTVSESCDQYSIISGGGAYDLAAGESLLVTVRFDPDSVGQHDCTIETGSADCDDVSCSGFGSSPCYVSPTYLDFHVVMVGDYRDLSFIITNIGVGILHGNVSEPCDHFSIVDGGGSYSLAVGDTLTVTVRYEPTEPSGGHSCTVETGLDLCSDVDCHGLGGGPNPDVCEVSPTNLDFGTVAVGDSLDKNFTIKNLGLGTLSGSVGESCDHYSIISGGGSYSLDHMESRSVTVRFEPSSAGSHDCTVETGAMSCYDVSCTGVGYDSTLCDVWPIALDFDTVNVGGFVDTSFVIINAGVDTLSGNVGETCDHFEIVSGGGGYSLAAGESLQVTVRFEPSSAGTHNCTIETGVNCTDVSCSGTATVISGQDVFVKTLGGSAYDNGGCLVQTSDGGFVAGGTTRSFGEGDTDNLISKFDASGNHLWTKAVGYGGVEGGVASIKEVLDGGIVVFGWSESFWADREHLIAKFDGSGSHLWSRTIRANNPWWSYGGPIEETSDGGLVVLGCTNSFTGIFDLYLSKFDSAGTHLWTKNLIGNDREWQGGLIEASDGRLVVAGSTRSFGAGDYDLLIAKFESSGNLLWANTMGGVATESSSSLIEASDGGYVVAGYTTSYGAGDRDLLVTKFDSTGVLVWTKALGGVGIDGGYSVAEASDGGYVVAGYTTSYGEGGYDLLLTKFAEFGDHLWSRTLGDSADDWGSSVVEATDGRLMVTGNTGSYGVGDRDLLMACFASTGYTCLGQNVTPVVTTVAPVTAAAGFTVQSRSPTITEPIPIVSAHDPDTTLVCDSSPSAVDDTPRGALLTISLEQNFPNPFNPTTTISFTLRIRENVNLSVYDVQGKLVTTLVDETLDPGVKEIAWHGKDVHGNQVSTGVYFYRLTAGKQSLTKKMVLLK
ncbi:MAG: choice-of-anchor D domain-containing protein, partial [Candidatus Latescibacterota bacterium]